MNYETIFIARPDLSEEQATALQQEAKGILAGKQTAVLNEQNWGRKKLAYSIGRNDEGYYFYIKFSSSNPSVPNDLTTFYRHSDSVLKFMTVKLDRGK